MLADEIPITLFDTQYANKHYISFLVEHFLTCTCKQQQNKATKQ